MKKRLTEEAILFVSVVKWVVLATVVGSLVGISTTCFVKGLEFFTSFAKIYPYYYFVLPIVLFMTAWLGYEWRPTEDAHSTDKVIEVIHESGKLSLASGLKAFILPILTIASGGSAGKEAPCADVGATVGGWIGKALRLNPEDRRKLMICGVSAGFASVFGVPIAGALFGVEVLFVGSILYEVILPSFIAGITAYHVSTVLGITYFYSPLTEVTHFSETLFIKVIIASIFFGVSSALFVEIMKLSKQAAGKISLWLPLKALIGGGVLVVLALATSSRYLGLGLDSIQSTLRGEKAYWYDPIMKTLFTSVTLAFGGIGGIITPVLFVGTTSGAAFASLFNLDVGTFSALGMVCLLAGTANTPISASIMAMELFGAAIAPYATVACIISFLMTGHRSIYPSQVLSMKKSSSLKVQHGECIGKGGVSYQQRNNTATDSFIKQIGKWGRRK